MFEILNTSTIHFNCLAVLISRDTYFMLGEANEKKTNMDDLEGLKIDPRY